MGGVVSRGLVFEKTVRPGVFVAKVGERSALVVAHVVNGRGVYGFEEAQPDPAIEAMLAKRSDAQVAKLVTTARELGG